MLKLTVHRLPKGQSPPAVWTVDKTWLPAVAYHCKSRHHTNTTEVRESPFNVEGIMPTTPQTPPIRSRWECRNGPKNSGPIQVVSNAAFLECHCCYANIGLKTAPW